MAEDPESEGSSDPTEEESDRPKSGDSAVDGTETAADDDESRDGGANTGDEGRQDDDPGADRDDDVIVDPTGLSGPSTSDRSENGDGADAATVGTPDEPADSDDSSSDDAGDSTADEDEGGLTRVDDESGEPDAPPGPGSRDDNAPPNRTRSGRPESEPTHPEEGSEPPGSEPGSGALEPTGEASTDEPEVVGPRPPEEAEPLINDPAEKYAPENIEEYWDDVDDLGDYGPEGAIGDPVEEPLEPTIEEPDTGGVLDRDGEGPPDDQEMPLTEHVEEMVWRLGVVVVTAAIVTILGYPFSEGLVLHIWSEVLPTADAPAPHIYGPLEKILTQIKVAGLAGILIALPLIVYQTYRFMRPGLYPHERRYYLAAVPTSLVLAAAGMAFSYFFLLPTLFVYFMYYTEGSVDIVAFGLSKTFTLIVTLTGVLAVVFQIPLFIMLAIMMGVTSRRWLASKRIYFWAAFAGISFLIAPDPTGMAPFFVAGTAIGLFEGTLFLLKWVKRGRQRYRQRREDAV